MWICGRQVGFGQIMSTSVSTYTEQFDKAFDQARQSYGNYEAFSEFIRIYAAEIAWACGNKADALMKDREAIISRIDDRRKKCYMRMFDAMVYALEENPDQDFLGATYMRLGVGDKSHGQFFTPYNIAKATAALEPNTVAKLINNDGFVSINEPSCGAGGMVIAFANKLQKQGANHQRAIYFKAQDISELPALMCYLQCSLLGMAGHVVIGNTLMFEKRAVLQTPMMLEDVWQLRQMRGEVPWPKDL